MKLLLCGRVPLCALLSTLGVGLVLFGPALAGRTAPHTNVTPNEAAVERARATVRMLDDLHKGYVVTITDTYVKAQKNSPAARVTKKVLKHMADKGYGTGRLLDATGAPLNEENVARTDFEKRAVAAIKAGKPYVDEVGTKDGRSVLRAATVVPVVMKQCIACHADCKEGDVLGALVYELPIQ